MLTVRLFLVFVLLIVWEGSQSDPIQSEPKIQTDQETNSVAKSKTARGQNTLGISNPLVVPQAPQPTYSQNDGDGRRDEGAEYRTVFGYKGRITDWLLSLFTFCLVVVGIVQGKFLLRTLRATEKAANAAKESADTQVAIELPIFVIERIDISKDAQQYTICLGNHGRTPAIIKANCFVVTLDRALPPVPRYRIQDLETIDEDRVVGNGNTYDIVRSPSISAMDWESLSRSETVLWVYGYLKYLDFLKHEHSEGFCVGFEPPCLTPASHVCNTHLSSGIRWSRQGPAAYTYNRTKERDEAQ